MDFTDLNFQIAETRADKREKNILKFVILPLIIALVITNTAWLYVFNSYDYQQPEKVEISTDGGGDANYIGKDGNIIYGEDYCYKIWRQNQEER